MLKLLYLLMSTQVQDVFTTQKAYILLPNHMCKPSFVLPHTLLFTNLQLDFQGNMEQLLAITEKFGDSSSYLYDVICNPFLRIAQRPLSRHLLNLQKFLKSWTVSVGRIEISAQNHNYAVDPDQLPSEVEVTHINLNDGTCAGILCSGKKAMSIQYHPEASPGPHDADVCFEQFINMVKAESSVPA